MPLQGDQRALLQLLCQRGQSYEDISGLLGISADQVHTKAREALTEIAGSDPDAEVALTDFLLGQADPIGRADAVRFLQGDPAGLELAATIQQGLRLIAPDAKQPNLPEPRGKRRRAALPDSSEETATPGAPAPGAEGDSASSDRTKLFAAGAAIGLIVIIGILAIAGVFSGAGDDSTSSTSSTSADASTTATGDTQITAVPLKPTAGSAVAGRATFGLISNQQLYVDVQVQGLDPNLPQSQSYLVWLMVGGNAGFPIDHLEADQNGSFSGRLAVPSSIALSIGNQATSVRVSSTEVHQLQVQINQATQQKVPILQFVGTELASGDIPIVKGKQAGG
jgi:hypothetical protein